MDRDLWRQWQQYGAQVANAGSFAAWPGLGPGLGSAAPNAPLSDAFERFCAAARAHVESMAQSAYPGAPARAFSDALRALFVELPSWTHGLQGSEQPIPGSLGECPALGPNRESQLRYQRLAAAWGRAADAQRRLQSLWIDALRDAATEFVSTLDLAKMAATSPEALYALYGQWVDRLEDVYAQMAHGEGFCAALADAVNAGSDWRHELRATIEQSAKMLDLPTRSEVSALVHRLKRVEAQLRTDRSPPGLKRKATRRKKKS